MWDRIAEYLAMGTPVCWIVDPIARGAWTATPGSWAEVTDGVLRAGDIGMPLDQVLE
jgi:hypothetical protein